MASDDSFAESETPEGDQFMSCKPWLGAIKKPTTEPLKEVKDRPDVSYAIEFVHGYKSDLTRQNLFYNNNMQPVYMTAALGVILDTEARTQTIFGGGEEKVQQRKQQAKGLFGHSDDIVALALTADRKRVATGQVGLEPMIFIWDAETAERLELMTLPKGCRSVSAISFSPDGRYVAAADMSDDHAIHVFDLETKDKKGKPAKLFTEKSDRQKVFGIQWKPTGTEFCSVGVKHICFWTLTP